MLVALEGIDGCGKSTQARLLTTALIERGLTATTFREPGDTEYGRELRRIFVEGRDVSPRQEMRLFLEDRRIDVHRNILPALAAGKMVIMDRYYLSSVVYQGARGVDPGEILAANEALAPRPELTLLLDLPVDMARLRIRAARGSTNTFEERDYLDDVRTRYLSYCDGEGIVRIDATALPEVVHRELLRLVLGRARNLGASAGSG